MHGRKEDSQQGHSKLMQYGMMACCAVMLLPVAGFLLAGGTIGGLWGNALVFAPLLLCVGAHLVMHKMMGKSCHGKSKDTAPQIKAIPLLTVDKTVSAAE